MIRKLIHMFAIHDWKYGIDSTECDDHYEIVMVRYCPICGLLEQVPPNRVEDMVRHGR